MQQDWPERRQNTVFAFPSIFTVLLESFYAMFWIFYAQLILLVLKMSENTLIAILYIKLFLYIICDRSRYIHIFHYIRYMIILGRYLSPMCFRFVILQISNWFSNNYFSVSLLLGNNTNHIYLKETNLLNMLIS